MVHLLYTSPKPELSDEALLKAGVDCYMDTIHPLVGGGVVKAKGERPGRRKFRLTNPATTLLETCVLANKRGSTVDLRVDYPQAFVIMPFSETWSDAVYTQMIEPAVISAELSCIRGDSLVRVGDLNTNIWNEIMRSGVIIAEVSAANVNVFYELGLTYALGKDALLLKRKDASLPADFGGAHYYEYKLDSLDSGRDELTAALKKWSQENHAKEVEALYLP